jgi:serine protease Do
MKPKPWIVVAIVLLVAPAASRAQALLDTPALAELSQDFQELTRRVEPAVVQIFSTMLAPSSGEVDVLARQRAVGSGVVLDPDGYIVTNAHVVRNARRVQVLLPRTEGDPSLQSILKPRGELVGAQVIATDDETDLAVLKVPRKGLTHLEVGDSDEVRKGSLVFAFGSPRGLENSVTMGVISATARQRFPEDPMIYLQTDASINPGNSGGALVDVEGRLVGINTFIVTDSGGSEGLGFAVPSNIVRSIFEQIRNTGRVRRGRIGIHPQTLNPFLAQGLGIGRDYGVLLGDVFPGSPAETAGLRSGDVVLSLDGKPMENGRQLRVNLYGKTPGEKVKLEILRDGKLRTVDVPVVEQRDDPGRFAFLARPEEHTVSRLGILGLKLNRDIAAMLPALRYDQGVVVAAVLTPVPTWEGGFLPGDVIYSVNGRRTGDLDQLRDVLGKLRLGQAAVVHVERDGQLQYLAVEIDS